MQQFGVVQSSWLGWMRRRVEVSVTAGECLDPGLINDSKWLVGLTGKRASIPYLHGAPLVAPEHGTLGGA